MSLFTQSTQSSVDPQPSQNTDSQPKTYTISGVKVEFPTRAYPSQLAMMSKVIQALKQKQNCLLESPTGSGKSLALLCAALAWQRHEAARVEKHNAEIDGRRTQIQAELAQAKLKEKIAKAKVEQELLKAMVLQEVKQENLSEVSLDLKATCEEVVVKKENLDSSFMTNDSLLTSDESMDDSRSASKNNLFTDDEDDDDFQPSKKPVWKKPSTPKFKQERTDEVKINIVRENRKPESEGPNLEDNYVSVPPEKKESVPKIYFGTRTHKQISQITRELRKTLYRTARSIILAGRDHTCVNPVVERLSNKNEACKELMDQSRYGGGCPWQAQATKYRQFSMLTQIGVPSAYDLEDLVTAGRVAKACPYYMSRQLLDQADIIFCPYNYLIDPAIRKSMTIGLEGHIVIFDEAHNMEDASREASSFVIYQDELNSAMQDFEKVGNKGNFEPFAHEKLAVFISTLSRWMDSHKGTLQSLGFDSSGKHWTGTAAVAELDVSGLSEGEVNIYLDYFKAIMQHREEEFEKEKERGFQDNTKVALAATTVKTMEDVFQMFTSLNGNKGKWRDDFRIALLKNFVRRRKDGGSSGPMTTKEVLSLNIWCLNPGVAFAALQDVHSIVLTSGTLSPMQSFQSELECPFPIKLEASHVIDPSQVFATMVSMGPHNLKLNGGYRCAETFEYQDELGHLVLNVCKEMPFGVLCFFPSYRMLDKVTERWRSTFIWDELNSVKVVLIEPRTGAQDFQEAINRFYEANEKPHYPSTGGLFLAVCRGKVSEGLDFADNNARAVICIGIPFPAFKDLQVELKRNYNQQNQKRGLLSGGEWYEIQAFRALNQALGRCIRHRHDWGAILLVDERFILTPRYVSSLSKWVRTSVRPCNDWEIYMKNLIHFRDTMLAKPVPEPSFGKSSSTPSISFGFENSQENSGYVTEPAVFHGETRVETSNYFFSSSAPSGHSSVTKTETFSSSVVSNSAPDNNTRSTPIKNDKGSKASPNTIAKSPSTIPEFFAKQTAAAKRKRSNW